MLRLVRWWKELWEPYADAKQVLVVAAQVSVFDIDGPDQQIIERAQHTLLKYRVAAMVSILLLSLFVYWLGSKP